MKYNQKRIIILVNVLFLIISINTYLHIHRFFFWPTGKLMSHGYAINGRPTGKWNFYNERGVIKAAGSFRNGKRIGVWKYFIGPDFVMETEDIKPENETVTCNISKATHFSVIDIPRLGKDTNGELIRPIFFPGGNFRYIEVYDNATQKVVKTRFYIAGKLECETEDIAPGHYISRHYNSQGKVIKVEEVK